MLSKSDEYRRDAQRAHIQAEIARMPQEKEVLLEIERLEGSQKKGVGPLLSR